MLFARTGWLVTLLTFEQPKRIQKWLSISPRIPQQMFFSKLRDYAQKNTRANAVYFNSIWLSKFENLSNLKFLCEMSNYNAMFTKLGSNIFPMKTMNRLWFCSMVSTARRISQNNLKKWHRKNLISAFKTLICFSVRKRRGFFYNGRFYTRGLLCYRWCIIAVWKD